MGEAKSVPSSIFPLCPRRLLAGYRLRLNSLSANVTIPRPAKGSLPTFSTSFLAQRNRCAQA
ncbi:hypothetical protein RvY_19340, partial [Ramazzottius varieornatus]